VIALNVEFLIETQHSLTTSAHTGLQHDVRDGRVDLPITRRGWKFWNHSVCTV